MANIELQNIVVYEKNTKIIDNVSLEVKDGEYLCLLGPTGSGGSFILKIIAGLIPIKSGKILIDGVDVTDTPPEDRHVGFVFEQFNLFPHLTVLDNLLYGPRMRREDLKVKTNIAKEVISLVRLDGRENAISKELSGGMQQRVGIARAVTAGAKILLLDQPYRALDAKIRSEMRYEIREIVKELGLTALHATHETEEAMITADRIAVFNQGRLEQVNLPDEIFVNPKSLFVATFIAESNTYDAILKSGIATLPEIEFTVNSNVKGNAKLVIRQQAVRIFLDSKPSGENVFEGEIIKIRLLGDFIRFVIKIHKKFVITSREMLSLKWSKFDELIGKNVYIKINKLAIKIFTD